jgi:hypothetical protein
MLCSESPAIFCKTFRGKLASKRYCNTIIRSLLKVLYCLSWINLCFVGIPGKSEVILGLPFKSTTILGLPFKTTCHGVSGSLPWSILKRFLQTLPLSKLWNVFYRVK